MLKPAAIGLTAKAPLAVGEAVKRAAAILRDAGLGTPSLDARLLVSQACGMPSEAVLLHPARPLNAAEQRRIGISIERRLAREPVSRILGYREFWGRPFAISPAVLDPRPDSETLIETVLDIVRTEDRAAQPLNILDLGTGSGCLLLTLLAELPAAHGIGVDISTGALEIAWRNAQALAPGRARFVCAGWLGGIAGPFDLVVANPPYIASNDMSGLQPEVACYDPRVALDGGADGLLAYHAIIPGLDGAVAPGGWAVFETGEGQAGEVAALLCRHGFAHCAAAPSPRPDLSGIMRVVAVKRQQAQE